MIDWFTQHLTSPTFAAAVLLAASGTGAFLLSRLAPIITKYVREKFTVSLHISSFDESYDSFMRYFGTLPFASKCRTITITEQWRLKNNKQEFRREIQSAIGPGIHTFKHKGTRFFLFRTLTEESTGGSYGRPKRKESIVLMALTRDRRAIEGIIDHINHMDDTDTVDIHMWSGKAYQNIKRRKRPLSTVYMGSGMKETINEDVKRYLAAEEQYITRGIPYRRGYLLSGPPGTGKSSLVFALASHFGKSVYLINPSSMLDDSELNAAFREIGESCFVLIEDIDCIKAGKSRSSAATTEGEPSLLGNGITLSGMLNAIDGVGAQEGRMLFITSNHPEVLDPALIRSGRIDRHFVLDKMHLPEALAMFDGFFPKADPEEFTTWITPKLPMAPADLQNHLLSKFDDEGRLIPLSLIKAA